MVYEFIFCWLIVCLGVIGLYKLWLFWIWGIYSVKFRFNVSKNMEVLGNFFLCWVNLRWEEIRGFYSFFFSSLFVGILVFFLKLLIIGYLLYVGIGVSVRDILVNKLGVYVVMEDGRRDNGGC